MVCACTINLLPYSPWWQNHIVIITLCHIHHPPPLNLSNHYEIAAVTSSLAPQLKRSLNYCPCKEDLSHGQKHRLEKKQNMKD